MKNYPKYVKTTLNHIIHDMGKHPEDFCVDPERNFTRNRELHFEDILSLLVKTVSAFVQQRVKIKPEALAHLFHKFTDTCSRPNLYKGGEHYPGDFCKT